MSNCTYTYKNNEYSLDELKQFIAKEKGINYLVTIPDKKSKQLIDYFKKLFTKFTDKEVISTDVEKMNEIIASSEKQNLRPETAIRASNNRIKREALSHPPNTPEEYIKQYLIANGSYSVGVVYSIFGDAGQGQNSPENVRLRGGKFISNKNITGEVRERQNFYREEWEDIAKFSDRMWEGSGELKERFDSQEFRNAAEQVIMGTADRTEMAQSIIDRYTAEEEMSKKEAEEYFKFHYPEEYAEHQVDEEAYLAEIREKAKFTPPILYKNAGDVVYGLYIKDDDGNPKIYLNPDVLNSGTLVHELSHLHWDMLNIAADNGDKEAKSLVEKGKELLTPLAKQWQEVLNSEYGTQTAAPFMMSVGGFDVQVKPIDVDVVDGFYSPLEQTISDTKFDKLPAKQWSDKFKGEEAKWTGLTEWLGNQTGSVSKAEIQNFLKENRIEIVEVVKGKPEIDINDLDAEFDGSGFKIKYSGQGNLIMPYITLDQINITEEDTYEDDFDYYSAQEAAKVAAINEILDREDGEVQFQQYQLPGESSNYKEILITLPPSEQKLTEIQDLAKRAASAEQLAEEMFRKNPNIQYSQDAKENGYDDNGASIQQAALTLAMYEGDAYGRRTFEDRLRYLTGDSYEEAKRLGEEVNNAYKNANKLSIAKVEGVFKSPHFTEPNILAHIRMSTRIDSEGNKILFLDEIQSDWGQRGKREGFKQPAFNWDTQLGKDAVVVLKRMNETAGFSSWQQLAREMIKSRDILNDFQVPYSNKDLMLKWHDAANQEMKVPSAPFVTNTSSWVKLALKTAIKQAIKQGATKIAWTTGEQQNDRYDLSKQVSAITYNKIGEDLYEVYAFKPKEDSVAPTIDNAGQNVLFHDKLSAKKIEDTFGKDIADKIVNDGGEGSGDAELDKLVGKTIEGDNLKVKGKGMIGFYGSTTDNKLGIVGEVAESLFGKGSIKTTELATKDGSIFESTIRNNGTPLSKKEAEDFYFANRDDESKGVVYIIRENGDFERAIKFKDITNASPLDNFVKVMPEIYSQQYSIDITPTIKAEVQRGLPMFQILGDNMDINLNSPMYARAENETEEQHLERIIDEVRANLIAKYGTEELDRLENTPSFIQQLKDWLKSIYEWIAEQVGLKGTNPKEIANMSLEEFTKRSFSSIFKGEYFENINQSRQQIVNRAKTTNAVYISRDGKPIGFNYGTDKLARERFDFSKLKRIGAGSDRIVFDLGDGKVLKVAKTARGLEQNILEENDAMIIAGILPDYYEVGLNYVVTEKVDPAPKKGVNKKFDQLIEDINDFGQRDFFEMTPELQDMLEKHNLTFLLKEQILWGDLQKRQNWGMKNGKPIHLDGGTFGGMEMITSFRGKKDLEDADFRYFYNKSKELKQKYQDTDKFTRFHIEGADTYNKSTELNINNTFTETKAYSTYQEALDKHGDNKQQNIYVNQKPNIPNTDKILTVQVSSQYMLDKQRQNGVTEQEKIFDKYFDKVYSKVEGYDRSVDFMEIPFWIAAVNESVGEKMDMYVMRSPEETVNFVKQAGYKKIMLSVLDANLQTVQKLVKENPSIDFLLGGYIPNLQSKFNTPNVKVFDTIEEGVREAGYKYKDGYKYDVFADMQIIPRLKMSDGCLYRCAFCTVKNKIEEVPKQTINEQVKAISKLKAKYVYLDDKTFGQAPNYIYLEDVYKKIQKTNPEFLGFIIQTTSATVKKIETNNPGFWQRAGIKTVEIGIESNNDSVLAGQRKPNSERLNAEAVEILRRNGLKFVPNLIIGFEKETRKTYENTIKFLKDNSDIISHANIYNLAVYEGTTLDDLMNITIEADRNENVLQKSFHSDPSLHRRYYKKIYSTVEDIMDGKSGKELPPLKASPKIKTPINTENPSIVDRDIAKVLTGITDRNKFNEAVQSLPYEGVKREYNSNSKFANELYKKYSSMDKISYLKAVDDTLSTMLDNDTASLFKETLKTGIPNFGIQEKITLLNSLSKEVWDTSGKEVREILSAISKEVEKIGMFLPDLPYTYYINPNKTVKNFLQKLSIFTTDLYLKSATTQDIDNFANTYNEYFYITPAEKFASAPTTNMSYVKVDTVYDPLKMFAEHDLLQTSQDIYQKINRSQNIEELYDELYDMVVGDPSILPINPRGSEDRIRKDIKQYINEQAATINNAVISDNKDVLEEYTLYKIVFEHPLIINTKRDIIKQYENYVAFDGDMKYLTGAFISDFNIKQKNNQKSALRHFEITPFGIKLKNNDDISKNEIREEFSNYKDLVNYASLIKDEDMNNLFEHKTDDGLSPTKEFLRTYYVNNPTALEEYTRKYNKKNDIIYTTFHDAFLRVGNEIFEKVSDGTYNKVIGFTNPMYNIIHAIEAPAFIKPSLKIIPKISPKIITYGTVDEREQIKKEHNSCA